MIPQSIKVPHKVSFPILRRKKAAIPAAMRTDLMSNPMILTKKDRIGGIRRSSRTSRF
jgi:hypothetical protein